MYSYVAIVPMCLYFIGFCAGTGISLSGCFFKTYRNKLCVKQNDCAVGGVLKSITLLKSLSLFHYILRNRRLWKAGLHSVAQAV